MGVSSALRDDSHHINHPTVTFHRNSRWRRAWRLISWPCRGLSSGDCGQTHFHGKWWRQRAWILPINSTIHSFKSLPLLCWLSGQSFRGNGNWDPGLQDELDLNELMDLDASGWIRRIRHWCWCWWDGWSSSDMSVNAITILYTLRLDVYCVLRVLRCFASACPLSARSATHLLLNWEKCA